VLAAVASLLDLGMLGNTPTVARASYVDPRVVDLYHDGTVVPLPTNGRAPSRAQAEKAVLDLLEEA
jgi:DNA topoisomerase IB